jgi:hypothetical protein
MCRSLGIVGLLALIAQGCTKRPEGMPLTAFRVDYQTWTCQQLAQEADLLSDAHVVASERQRSARTDATVEHLKAATEAVHKASTLKKCRA